MFFCLVCYGIVFLGLWERGLKMIDILFHGLVVYLCDVNKIIEDVLNVVG